MTGCSLLWRESNFSGLIWEIRIKPVDDLFQVLFIICVVTTGSETSKKSDLFSVKSSTFEFELVTESFIETKKKQRAKNVA